MMPEIQIQTRSQATSHQRTLQRSLAGHFTSNAIVHLFGVRLPEFRCNVSLTELKARVFNNDCHYDIIMGHDALQVFRIQLDFEKNMI